MKEKEYKDMDLYNFLRILGANEKIIKFIEQTAVYMELINWVDLRETWSNQTEGVLKEKKVTFSNSPFDDKSKTTISIDYTGNVKIDNFLKNEFRSQVITIKDKEVIVRDKDILFEEKDGKLEYSSMIRRDREYDFDGILHCDKLVEGKFLNPDFDVDQLYHKEAGAEKYAVVRRTPIGYMTYIHAVNYEEDIIVNGYQNVSTRNICELKSDQNVDLSNIILNPALLEMSSLASTRPLTEGEQNFSLENKPENVCEYFKEAFKQPFKPEYLNGLEIQSGMEKGRSL